MKVRMVRCYVSPVLLYGLEGCTLNKETSKRLESFELWVLNISSLLVLVLERMDKEMLFTIKRRKLEFLGHVMRNLKYEILQLIL